MLDGLRLFSALLSALAVSLVTMFSGALGLSRPIQFIAGMLTLATSSLFHFGTIVNPSSAALLTGALVAAAGIFWLRRGKGFVWLLLAVGFTGLVAFIFTLPSIVFALFIMAMLFLRKINYWQGNYNQFGLPKLNWYQPIALLSFSFLPLFAWVTWISSRSTVSNSDLYGFAPIPSFPRLIANVMSETFKIHSPWFAYEEPSDLSDLSSFLKVLSSGVPLWISLFLIGSVLFFLIFRVSSEPKGSYFSVSVSGIKGFPILICCTLFVFVIYPAILRAANAIVSGFDYPIVERYSMSLAPLLILLTVLIIKNKLHVWLIGLPVFVSFFSTIASGFSYLR
jgi:hypothetical protein